MKKIYRKSTVHPTPQTSTSDNLLSLLPATILTLATALSPQDRQVLAYLISCSSSSSTTTTTTTTNHRKKPGGGATTGTKGVTATDHPPSFSCYCFRCYMSYWARWDASQNRQLIHDIIDAFEESLFLQKNTKERSKREHRGKRKNTRGNGHGTDELVAKTELSLVKSEFAESNSVVVENSTSTSGGGEYNRQVHNEDSNNGENEEEDDDEREEEELEKGSVRKFVSFLGERIWSVWT